MPTYAYACTECDHRFDLVQSFHDDALTEWVGDTIVFRTMAASPLAELVRPMEVSFQVDDLDDETTTGWSILLHGTSGAPVTELPANMPAPWAPGDRPIVIGIAVDHFAGRSISAD